MRKMLSVMSVPEIGILMPLAVFAVVFQILSPSFLCPESLAAMLRGMAFVGVIGVGQTLLMVAGEIDLSVGTVAGLSAVGSAWLMKEAGCPVAVGVAGGLLVGGVMGAINGVVTVCFRIPSFIATLGMLYIARGLNYLLCKGYPIYPLPESLKAFGGAEPLGLSWAFMVFVVLVAAGDLMLRKTVPGRMIYAVGGNREVARIAGIPTGMVKWMCFVFTGMMAGLAGILLMAQINVGQPEIGVGWELDVIAGVVIGGVSLFGGVGTVAGTFLGLMLMQVVRSGLVVTGVNTHWQTVATGVIMIVAVGVDLLRRRWRSFS
jgi:ribose transport system permease protein